MTVEVEALRSLLQLDHETGQLFWKKRDVEWFQADGLDSIRIMNAWNARHAGKPALNGDNGRGYLRGSILGHSLLAHRAVWSIYYGEHPMQEIDHINGDKTDNRILNLRACTRLQNLHNTSPQRSSAGRFKGVYRDGGRWTAKLRHNGKSHCVGSFGSEVEAAKAYDICAVDLRGEFARTNQSLGLFKEPL